MSYFDREDQRTAIDYALVVGEMEGVYSHLKRMGHFDDMEILSEMRSRYYKLYFAARKAEREQAEN